MNRVLKKTLYTLFFIFIIGLIFLPSFLNLKDKKVEEKKIDVLPLEIKDEPKVFYLNDKQSVIVFKVFNPNSNFSAANFLYNLKIYSFDNQLIDSILDKGYIYYNEEKYFLNFISTNIYKKIKQIDITLMNFDFLDKKVFLKPLIKVDNVTYEKLEDKFFIKGEVANFSAFDLSQVELLFLFQNKQNKLLTAYFYKVGELLRNDKKAFDFEIKFDSELEREIDFNYTKIFVYGK